VALSAGADATVEDGPFSLLLINEDVAFCVNGRNRLLFEAGPQSDGYDDWVTSKVVKEFLSFTTAATFQFTHSTSSSFLFFFLFFCPSFSNSMLHLASCLSNNPPISSVTPI